MKMPKRVNQKKKVETPQGDPTVKSILDAFDGELV
jgi:hypothetical protein